jgi:hypothetical protein
MIGLVTAVASAVVILFAVACAGVADNATLEATIASALRTSLTPRHTSSSCRRFRAPGTGKKLEVRLARTPYWRHRLNLTLWQRVMRTREAGQQVVPLLDAIFNPRPDNAATRRKLLRYLV